jgi:hypothetical protein
MRNSPWKETEQFHILYPRFIFKSEYESESETWIWNYRADRFYYLVTYTGGGGRI